MRWDEKISSHITLGVVRKFGSCSILVRTRIEQLLESSPRILKLFLRVESLEGTDVLKDWESSKASKPK